MNSTSMDNKKGRNDSIKSIRPTRGHVGQYHRHSRGFTSYSKRQDESGIENRCRDDGLSLMMNNVSWTEGRCKEWGSNSKSANEWLRSQPLKLMATTAIDSKIAHVLSINEEDAWSGTFGFLQECKMSRATKTAHKSKSLSCPRRSSSFEGFVRLWSAADCPDLVVLIDCHTFGNFSVLLS